MDELLEIIFIIIAIPVIYLTIKAWDFAHWIGSGFGVTLEALIFTIAFIILLILFLIKKYEFFFIKIKTFISISLIILWKSWYNVLLSKVELESSSSSSSSFYFQISPPWWSNGWFFWVIEIIFIAFFIYSVWDDYFIRG